MEENNFSGRESGTNNGTEKCEYTDVEKQHIENAKRMKRDIDCDNIGNGYNVTYNAMSTNNSTGNGNCKAGTSTGFCDYSRRRSYKLRYYRRFSRDDESSTSGSVTPDEPIPQNSAPLDTLIHSQAVQEADETSDTDTTSVYSENTSSPSMIPDSDSDSDEEHPVLKKPKPKHNWFVLPEITNRQFGDTAKKQTSQLFQRRCYGSLHCVQRLELMYKLEKHESCVNCLNFHPNGDLLASGSDDSKVVLWDWKSGKSLLSFDTKHKANVFQSKFLPLYGDLHIATSSQDGQVRLAQISKQEGLRSSKKLGSHRGPCRKLSILKDQPFIIFSVGEDAITLRHDLRTSKQEKILTVKNGFQEIPLYSINSHPLNSNEFCVAGRDFLVRSYDQRKCSENHVLNEYYASKLGNSNTAIHVTCAVYNHNGSEILASYNDEDIYLFDTFGVSGSFIHHYQGHRNRATIKAVDFFGPKSEFIVSGSDCGNIYFWERDTEAIVRFLADDNGVVNCLESHPQLPFLCTSGLDLDVKLWMPLFENEQPMNGLASAVKKNYKDRSNWNQNSDDGHILWMLWRQLRRNEQRAMENNRFDVETLSLSSSNGSSGTPGSEDEASSELSDGPSGCTTS